jgi:hypothetical protein
MTDLTPRLGEIQDVPRKLAEKLVTFDYFETTVFDGEFGRRFDANYSLVSLPVGAARPNVARARFFIEHA